jgi:hypothetical protein
LSKQVKTIKKKRCLFAVSPEGAGQGSPAFGGSKTGMFYAFRISKSIYANSVIF